MENTTKAIIAVLALVFIVVLVSDLVNAEFWACADKGQTVEYCNNYKPPRTCTSNSGCIYCMSEYNEAQDCYIHGVWPECNTMPQTCEVGVGNGSGIDSEPPILTIISPSQDQLFNSRKALVQFSVNEVSNVYYTDVIEGRGRWSRLCSDCTSYSKNLSFDEGQNIIMFKAIDLIGNVAYSNNISFFTDSKDPKIKKTEPRKGFANGDFYIEIQEENPETLMLFYGSNSKEVNIDSECEASTSANKKYYCNTNVDLSSYDGQEVDYWVTLEDIVGNIVTSKINTVSVDMTAPQVINSGDFFHYENGTKYVYFHLNISEVNFEEVVYSYIDDRGRLRDKRICSRLKEGMCEKRLSFREGEWALTVIVWDEAGNSVALPANFNVEY